MSVDHRQSLLALREAQRAIGERWIQVAEYMERQGCPVWPNAMLGGGLTCLEVPSENPNDFVWLGGADEEDCDGPWTCEDPAAATWVGGYRYTGNDDEMTHYSDQIMVEVAMPGDLESVADAAAESWRRLRSEPTPHQQ